LTCLEGELPFEKNDSNRLYTGKTMSYTEDALAFRKAYRQDTPGCITQTGFVNERIWKLQLRLIEEEFCELVEASDDLLNEPTSPSLAADLLKECADLHFVLYQFCAAHGLDLDAASDRVFKSNMSKLDENGQPIFREDGKVLKGPLYQPPSLIDLVESAIK